MKPIVGLFAGVLIFLAAMMLLCILATWTGCAAAPVASGNLSPVIDVDADRVTGMENALARVESSIRQTQDATARIDKATAGRDVKNVSSPVSFAGSGAMLLAGVAVLVAGGCIREWLSYRRSRATRREIKSLAVNAPLPAGANRKPFG